jgi:hypothetical protein
MTMIRRSRTQQTSGSNHDFQFWNDSCRPSTLIFLLNDITFLFFRLRDSEIRQLAEAAPCSRKQVNVQSSIPKPKPYTAQTLRNQILALLPGKGPTFNTDYLPTFLDIILKFRFVNPSIERSC